MWDENSPYARVASCKRYTEKTAISAADLLNDRVIPLYAGHKIDLLRVLTDRGTEYCGKLENPRLSALSGC